MIKDVRNLFRQKKEIDGTTIKDVRSLVRLKKEMDDATFKDIRNPFRLKKENKTVKDRISGDIGNLFEHKKVFINQ